MCFHWIYVFSLDTQQHVTTKQSHITGAEQQHTSYNNPHGTHHGTTHSPRHDQSDHKMQGESDQEAGTESRNAQDLTPMAQLPHRVMAGITEWSPWGIIYILKLGQVTTL